jgi:predicted RNase H-like HicB family nuclease
MIFGMATYHQFIESAMEHAQYEKMESGEWFASIPGLAGLWASGPNVEVARKDLLDALHGWIEVTIKTGSRVPAVGGISLYDDLQRVADD